MTLRDARQRGEKKESKPNNNSVSLFWSEVFKKIGNVELPVSNEEPEFKQGFLVLCIKRDEESFFIHIKVSDFDGIPFRWGSYKSLDCSSENFSDDQIGLLRLAGLLKRHSDLSNTEEYAECKVSLSETETSDFLTSSGFSENVSLKISANEKSNKFDFSKKPVSTDEVEVTDATKIEHASVKVSINKNGSGPGLFKVLAPSVESKESELALTEKVGRVKSLARQFENPAVFSPPVQTKQSISPFSKIRISPLPSPADSSVNPLPKKIGKVKESYADAVNILESNLQFRLQPK